MTRRKTGGGTFDPSERSVFFLAGGPMFIGRPYPYLLVGVDNLMEQGTQVLDQMLDGAADRRVFLDSGIFALTMAHARAHDVHMDTALGLAPDQIDGFDELFDGYVRIATEYQDRLWGYVELDQGGLVNKRKTRAKLEGLGLRPIPVYHPLVDGWDYLDELADTYDRICVGNVVWGSRSLRRDMLLMIHERLRRKKRPPWVHVLGHTPNPLFLSVPFNSADSTHHLYSMKYGSSVTVGRGMLQSFSRLDDPGYSYDRRVPGDDHDRGWAKGFDFLGYVAWTDLLTWRLPHDDLERELGRPLATYEPLVKGERPLLEAPA